MGLPSGSRVRTRSRPRRLRAGAAAALRHRRASSSTTGTSSTTAPSSETSAVATAVARQTSAYRTQRPCPRRREERAARRDAGRTARPPRRPPRAGRRSSGRSQSARTERPVPERDRHARGRDHCRVADHERGRTTVTPTAIGCKNQISITMLQRLSLLNQCHRPKPEVRRRRRAPRHRAARDALDPEAARRAPPSADGLPTPGPARDRDGPIARPTWPGGRLSREPPSPSWSPTSNATGWSSAHRRRTTGAGSSSRCTARGRRTLESVRRSLGGQIGELLGGMHGPTPTLSHVRSSRSRACWPAHRPRAARLHLTRNILRPTVVEPRRGDRLGRTTPPLRRRVPAVRDPVSPRAGRRCRLDDPPAGLRPARLDLDRRPGAPADARITDRRVPGGGRLAPAEERAASSSTGRTRPVSSRSRTIRSSSGAWSTSASSTGGDGSTTTIRR